MARSLLLLYSFSRRRLSDSVRGLFFIPTTLALLSSLSILFYISSTSNLFLLHTHQTPLTLERPSRETSSISSPTETDPSQDLRQPAEVSQKLAQETNPSRDLRKPAEVSQKLAQETNPSQDLRLPAGVSQELAQEANRSQDLELPAEVSQKLAQGNHMINSEVYHDRAIFLENYKEMNKSFKIYVYPHRKTDPFAHAFLPVDFKPKGNYASESYFRKVLMKSHFITQDPSEADLFFLPFSISRLRHDPRIGVGGIQSFVRDYIFNISRRYPYWNRTGGADHFYVGCHSVSRSAMDKADEVKLNAIQVVCSSSYFLSGYIPHKDASLPQIWPRRGDPPNFASSERDKLAFFAGSVNSRVRLKLLQTWRNDSEIFVHFGRLSSPYDKELLGSKFCLHVKGYEVNTARVGDALYYGCVPVIIANHYDLPFQDVLNWKSLSIVVATLDIPLLKKVLKGISFDEYKELQSNVLNVRRHFKWHISPVDYDAFYMVMYELWLRRSSTRLPSMYRNV